MQNVGNSFSLPFKSQNWASTFVLMGLIFLIPIVGWINLLGWMLALVDNYRAGRTDLPPAGFRYIGRGGTLFLVFLVYGIVIAAILVGPFILILGSAIASSGSNSGDFHSNFSGSTAFSGGLFTYIGLIQVFSLAIYLFYPAVIVATERGGFGGGLNIVQVFRLASKRWKNTIIAGLLIYVAGFLGGLGFYACCVGILFSLPYGYAVMAGVVRYYEAEFEGPVAGPATMPPPPPPPAPTPRAPAAPT
jgi:Protein of unknown function (DUF4013)